MMVADIVGLGVVVVAPGRLGRSGMHLWPPNSVKTRSIVPIFESLANWQYRASYVSCAIARRARATQVLRYERMLSRDQMQRYRTGAGVVAGYTPSRLSSRSDVA